jgi:hypothetical protein
MPALAALGHVEDAVEVGLHDHVPVRLGHLLERHVARDAGVVHQHVDRADVLGHRVHAGLARVEIGDVTGIGVELETLRLHLLEPVPGLGVARTVGRHDLVAQRGHLDADRLAQSAHASRNKCHSRHDQLSFA